MKHYCFNSNIYIYQKEAKWKNSEVNTVRNVLKVTNVKKKGLSIRLSNDAEVKVFNHKWKTGGYSLILNDSKKSYSLSQSNKGGMWIVEKLYILLEDGTKPVLTINYSYKKWKENIEVEKIDISDSNLDLIIYGLFIMRRLQAAESAAASPVFYG